MIRYTVYFSMVSTYNELICLYDTSSPDNEATIYEPKLELEEGSAGTFEFSMPPTHPYYNMMQPRQTLITIHRNNEWLWEGQVMDTTDNFYKERSVYCEGALAYLNDTIQMAKDYDFMIARQYIESILNNHNLYIEDYAPYKVIKCGHIPNPPNFPEHLSTDYENTMKYISDFLDNYGGHLYLTKNGDGEKVLNIYDYYLNTSNQSINFGVNLLDYSAKKELPDFCTVVIPLGATIENEDDTSGTEDKVEKRVTIEDVNEGKPFLTLPKEVIDQYGWIEKTIQFDDISEPSKLLDEAKNYLETINAENITLEVTALDMAYLKREAEA